jgi:hypothetical protein
MTNLKSVIYIEAGEAYPYHGSHNVAEQFYMTTGQPVLIVTRKQGEAFNSVVQRQGRENYLGASFGGSYVDYYVAVRFSHIMVGIEPDGYTHS